MGRRWIDFVLDYERLRARHPGHNLWKAPGVRYTDDEIKASRLVSKNVNGLHFLADIFREMYPDAVFLCLIRNPLALAEGQIRRRLKPERFVQRFRLLTEKMLEDVNRYENYHLFRFEELLMDPQSFLHRTYEVAQLDPNELSGIRMQRKATTNEQGEHSLDSGQDREVVWYSVQDFVTHFNYDVNENQIAVLGQELHQFLVRELSDCIKSLGYKQD